MRVQIQLRIVTDDDTVLSKDVIKIFLYDFFEEGQNSSCVTP
jgi:hypothetical protein